MNRPLPPSVVAALRAALTKRGTPTARGASTWSLSQVSRLVTTLAQ